MCLDLSVNGQLKFKANQEVGIKVKKHGAFTIVVYFGLSLFILCL